MLHCLFSAVHHWFKLTDDGGQTADRKPSQANAMHSPETLQLWPLRVCSTYMFDGAFLKKFLNSYKHSGRLRRKICNYKCSLTLKVEGQSLPQAQEIKYLGAHKWWEDWAGDGKIEWGLVCSNAHAVLVHCGKDRQEPIGSKASNLIFLSRVVW